VKCEDCGGLGYKHLAVPEPDPYRVMTPAILGKLFARRGGMDTQGFTPSTPAR
jgi:hypothetical protein